mgnify:CR=1 FL=1
MSLFFIIVARNYHFLIEICADNMYFCAPFLIIVGIGPILIWQWIPLKRLLTPMALMN